MVTSDTTSKNSRSWPRFGLSETRQFGLISIKPRLTKPDSSGHRTQSGKANGGTIGTDKNRNLLFKKR